MDWRKLIDEHGPALVLYARQWANSHADAEDALQDGLVRFWRAWQRGRVNADAPIGLLYACVKRSALDRLRSGKRRAAREEQAADLLYDAEPMFESGLDAREQQSEIADALKRLPEEQREAVVMKIWGGLTFREIAESLQIPQDTAASRYRYALKALARRLATRES